MKFGNTVVKHRRIILIAALVLLIPSVLGVIATRINYDMLYYLPEDIETVQGQNVLLDEFGKGGFSIVVVEDMKSDDVSDRFGKHTRPFHTAKHAAGYCK